LVSYVVIPKIKLCVGKVGVKGGKHNVWLMKTAKCRQKNGKWKCEIKFPKSTIAEPYQRFYSPMIKGLGWKTVGPKSYKITNNPNKLMAHIIKKCPQKITSKYPSLSEMKNTKVKIVTKYWYEK